MDNEKPQKTKQPGGEQPAEQTATPDAGPAPVISEPTPELTPDEEFDFGGLPARNLKKNLGCGG
jgi:hypothetical protein